MGSLFLHLTVLRTKVKKYVHQKLYLFQGKERRCVLIIIFSQSTERILTNKTTDWLKMIIGPWRRFLFSKDFQDDAITVINVHSEC